MMVNFTRRLDPDAMKKTLLIALAGLMMAGCAQQNPVLTVTGGQIQGVESANQEVIVYKGVPFAAPPVGELRWQEPQPVEAWDGVLTADTFSAICPQPGNPPGTFYGDEFYWEGNPEESEDCLYLNIWAPAKTVGKTDATLPVAMWVHGGAFMNGYGHEVTMDGDAWAERGVILVTINYRLGRFGFMSHPLLSEEQGGKSGNYGMLDQVAALRWISENIAQFGGDPDNITIFGQSAGAMSIKDLVTSPLSKDMVAKAIIQSGGGVSNFPGREPAPQSVYDEQGKKFMDANGWFTLEEMRAASWEEIKNAASDGGRFSPHPDGYFMDEDFNTAALGGRIADIPYMIGCTADDMGGLGGNSISYFCELRSEQSDQPAYQYYFKRNPPGDDDDPEKDPGAFHSAELWYMFGTLDNSWRPFTEADRVLSNEMLDAWTSFCRDGNPGWDEYTKANPVIKEFDVK